MTLELKAGKRYVRRDGEITGPLMTDCGAIWPFQDPKTEAWYKPDGRWSPGSGTSSLDLIREYIEEPSPSLITMDGDWEIAGIDGQVRILCIDAPDPFPVVVLVKKNIWRFRADGTNDHGRSLRPCPKQPEKIVRYVNVYRGGTLPSHHSRRDADEQGSDSRFACVRLECIEGQADD